MDDVLVPGSGMDIEYIEQNPEAIFDLITMKSMQERYGGIESPRGSVHETEAIYQNEVEFETFVQQFPIDDAIAECFATAADTVSAKQEAKFVSVTPCPIVTWCSGACNAGLWYYNAGLRCISTPGGGKRPQMATKYSKLKKKFGFKGPDDTSLISEDEIRTRDSKRSKKGGGVFSKRHKWRNLNGNANKKAVNFSDQSERSGSENTSEIASASQHADCSAFGEGSTRTDSCSVSDSQITSFSETFIQEMDQTVPIKANNNHSKIPVRYSRTNTSIYQNRSFSSSDEQHELADLFTEILSGTSSEIIQKIEDLQPTEVLKLRDHIDNNLLHRSVLVGNPDIIKYVMENYPEMTSEMNKENETAVEMAAKFGKYDCLKVILERNQRRHSLGMSLLNRLLNVCAQYGQADCLSMLLTYLSRNPHNSCTLPGDARGNTAAHVAARHGHIHCLQTLVAAGYDVTVANLMQQRPLHVAHQSRSHACFEYLLLLNICEELLSSLRTNVRLNTRLNEQLCSMKPSLEHVRSCLKRYGDLCTETNQLLTENKISILQTLNNLQEDLKLFVQHTSMTSAAKRKEARDKLEELSAEIERLEDTFEFSPLSEMDGALNKLFSSLDDVVHVNDDVSNSEELEENSSILSSLIRDIHKECMLENWDTSNVYERYLKLSKTLSGVGDQNFHRNYENVETTHEANDSNVSKSQNPKTQPESLTDVVNSQDSCTDVGIRQETVVHGNDESENNYSCIERTITDDHAHVLVCKEETGRSSPVSDSENQLQDIKSEIHVDLEEIDNIGVLSKNQLVDRDENDELENEDKENQSPTERPFTKLLSLDERIDLLIAGERDRENDSDLEHVGSSAGSKDSNPDGIDSIGSLYTSTFTSVTSETSGASDWYSKFGFGSLETTSSDDVTNDTTTDTASYWWDIGDDRPDVDTHKLKVSFPYGNDIKRKIHLNLENDGSSYDELREHRIRSHLRSMQQTRFSTGNYRERITTSTGEVMGGFHYTGGDQLDERSEHARDSRVVVDVNGALRERNNNRKPKPIPRKRGQPKLFTLEDAIATKPMNESEFKERYDRHRTSGLLNMKWENMSITDDEDEKISWSDYSRGYGARSDTDTTSGSQTPQSYV